MSKKIAAMVLGEKKKKKKNTGFPLVGVFFGKKKKKK